VRLVGFTIEIYYDARSYKHQTSTHITKMPTHYPLSWADMDRYGPLGSCGIIKRRGKLSDINRRLSAVCGWKAPSHIAVVNWARTPNSGTDVSP